MQKTDWLIAVCGFALFILLSSWAILRVPMNMDEALAYHVLACSDHPASFWNTFTLACGEHYNLTTPFGFTYSRAYDYVGGLDSFLYTPFYRLYPSPYVQYVFGLFYYILFALCLSRLISKPWLGFFVFLCFFPALFQFIHDTGPIKFTALVFALTPLVYRQAIKEKPVPQVAAGLLMGILFALATEEKVLFVHLLLPLFLFTLGETQIRGQYTHPLVSFLCDLRKKPFSPAFRDLLKNKDCGWPFASSLALMSAIGIGMLFLSKVPGWRWYILFLKARHAGLYRSLSYVLHNFRLYALLWPSFAHRIFDPAIIPMQWCLQFVTLAFLVVCVFAYRKSHGLAACPPLRAKLLLSSTLSCAVVLIALRAAWAGHHFVFMWFPMLVLFAELLAGLQVTPALLLALAYFSINLASLFALSAITPNPDTAWERGKIFAYFSTPDLAAHSIVNYSSWGAYSIPALYAPPDALVIYIEPLNASSVAKLYEVSQRTHRQIFDICLGENCTAEKLADSFGHRLRFRELQLGLNDWHVFAGESP